MKKYISLLAIAIVAVISSCSNEDVTVSKTVNFTVNPSTVVEPFVEKYSYILTNVLGSNKGELESFSTDYKLRVRLFVYDKNGELAKKASGDFSNYDVKLKESIFLPVGSYTAIAISDVYSPGKNFEFWSVSGEDHLATLKIEETGYYGDCLTILGATKQNFMVGDTGVDVNIDIKSAGALFLVLYSNVYIFSDVKEYELSVNKLQKSINYDSNGDYTISTQNNNGSFDWRINSIVLKDLDTQYINQRRWATQLPMNNVSVCFSYWTNDATKPAQLGNGYTWDIKAGNGYFCWLSLSSTEWSTYYLTVEEATDAFKGSSRSRASEIDTNDALLLNVPKSLRRNDAAVGQYLYPKNL